MALELSFRFTGLSDEFLPRRNPQIWAATGSNGWTVSGARSASGHPLLMASPHMPWFGFTQLMESHLQSKGGVDGAAWNFIGAGFYGSPTPADCTMPSATATMGVPTGRFQSYPS